MKKPGSPSVPMICVGILISLTTKWKATVVLSGAVKMAAPSHHAADEGGRTSLAKVVSLALDVQTPALPAVEADPLAA